MTPMTDDELGVLLSETFTAHEHLAEPDRAVALATDPRAPRPRRAPVLLAAAASVALVATGTAYLVSQRGDAGPGISSGPNQTISSTPSYPPILAPHVTHAQAVAAAKRVISRVAVFPGSHETDSAGVPELNGPSMTSNPKGYTVTRSRWWTASGTTPIAVAHWYNAHPTRGFVSQGGLGSTSGTGDPTIEFVDFQRQGDIVTPVGVRINLQTTTTAAGVGIRATVESVWSPARAAASYATGVTSIDVLLTTSHFGQHVHSSRHHWTISDPAQLARVVTSFNRLHGNPPFSTNCPMIVKSVEYRVVFHSPHGDLVASINTGCGEGVSVSRNGAELPPALADPTPLVHALQSTR